MSKQRFTLSIVMFGALLVSSVTLAQPAAPPGAVPPSASNDAMLFVANAGQWPAAARFQVWGSPAGAGTTWLAQDAIWVVVAADDTATGWQGDTVTGWQGDPGDPGDSVVTPSPHHPVTRSPVTLSSAIALKLTFPGSNPGVRIEPLTPVATTVSYYLGEDPARWRAAVPVYDSVRYVDLYPGVDLVIGAADSFWQLEAEPGAMTEQVEIQVEGAAVDGVIEATLRLAVEDELLTLALPQASFTYRSSGVTRQGTPLFVAVAGAATRQPAVPNDNPSDLIYSTFLGGTSSDYGSAVAVDGAGNATITGSTWSSTSFPITPGAFDPSYNGSSDAFVARLNPAGSGLVYATFLGGSNADFGLSIAVDSTGNAFVTGSTQSSDFPTTSGAFDTGFHGSQDAFVVKLNATGSALDYGTFLGGANVDDSRGIAVDAAGNAYMTGWTESGDFPSTPGAFDPSYAFGDQPGDAFAVKLNPSGSSLAYATFLGGNRQDQAYAIAVDAAGSAYVTGFIYSVNFPTTSGAFDTSYNYSGDSFVVKLNPAGSALDYGTFLGGGEEDYGNAIAVDATGSAYVVGHTASYDFPATPGAFDTSFAGGYYADAFAVKVNADGAALAYATYLGGSQNDTGQAVAIDGAGCLYLVGYTGSSSFPTTPDAFDSSFNSNNSYYPDAFAAKLSASGSELDYATFLGGVVADRGSDIAAGESGRAYVVGYTRSSNFPTTPGAFARSLTGYEDAFIARLAMGGTPPTPTATPTATVTPTGTPTRTTTPTRTPTTTALPWPDLGASRKSAWPPTITHLQIIFYDVYLKNSGGVPAQVAIADAPPLPYIPDSAWGGLVWDPDTETLRWQGSLQVGEVRILGYGLTGPEICAVPGTVYTNTLTIDDGYHLPFVRSAQVVLSTGTTPWASCTPTTTPTATATTTPTSTATATPAMHHRYLPLMLRQ